MNYCFCLDGEGNIIYSRGTNYEIKYFNSEGKLFRIVRKEYQPQSITQERQGGNSRLVTKNVRGLT